MSRHIGGKRLVTQITEVEPLGDDGRYRLRDIFTMQSGQHGKDDKTMQLTWTGMRSVIAGMLRPSEQKTADKYCSQIFGKSKD